MAHYQGKKSLPFNQRPYFSKSLLRSFSPFQKDLAEKKGGGVTSTGNKNSPATSVWGCFRPWVSPPHISGANKLLPFLYFHQLSQLNSFLGETKNGGESWFHGNSVFIIINLCWEREGSINLHICLYSFLCHLSSYHLSTYLSVYQSVIGNTMTNISNNSVRAQTRKN